MNYDEMSISQIHLNTSGASGLSDMLDIDKCSGIHVLFIFHNDLNTNSAAR